MGASERIIGVGTGQPHRVDHLGEQHQARLNPGIRQEIPENSISGTRARTEGEVPREHGWRVQEAAQYQQGSHWQSGRTKNWQEFASGRRKQDGPNQGAVTIGGEPPVRQSDPVVGKTPNEPQSQTGILRRWHQAAARFEEWALDTARQRGSKQNRALPGTEQEQDRTGESGPSSKNYRRRVRLLT